MYQSNEPPNKPMKRPTNTIILTILALLCLPAPSVPSDWAPVDITPSATLHFPPGGGTCTTTLKLPRNGMVKAFSLNITGIPAETNLTFDAKAQELWDRSSERRNVTLGPCGIGLGDYGSWWEENAVISGERARAIEQGGLDPILHNMTYDAGNAGLVLDKPYCAPYLADEYTIGLWHFDEGRGQQTNDSSKNLLCCTLGLTSAIEKEDPAWGQGRFNGGLLFDGQDDQVAGPDTALLNMRNQWTVEAWLRPECDISASDSVNIASKVESGDGWAFQIYQGKLSYDGPGTALLDAEGPAHTWTAGQWYHVAATYDGNTSRVFENGILVGSISYSGGAGQMDGPFRIGGSPDVSGSYFPGTIDEVRISSIARQFDAFINGSILSPVLNISMYSRVQVQGRFPKSTGYSIDVLDPAMDNTTIQEGLRNGDELAPALWDGLGSPCRELVLRLNVNTSNPNSTPILGKWGIGTRWLAGPEMDGLPYDGDARVRGGQAALSTEYAWNQAFPVGQPKGRQGSQMVHLMGTGAEILWGGQSSSSWVYPSEMYSYYPDENAWINPIPANTPPPRHCPSMVFDGNRNRAYMYGGVTGLASSVRSDLWSYDPILNSWSEITPASSPPPRYGPVMAYDSENDLVVMFGGFGSSGTVIGDCWVYSPARGTWTQRNSNTVPDPRGHSTMVYDEREKLLVLFGGLNAGNVLGDTWTYDTVADAWANMKPANGPPARYGAAMAYDSIDSKIILFGGSNAVNDVSDTWTYVTRTNSWTAQNLPSSPSARQMAAMVYDPEADLSVLYSGITAGDTIPDTWHMSKEYAKTSYIITPGLSPIWRTYGNVFVNATTPLETGYWVNVTDENGTAILSGLKNGDPLPVNIDEHPMIRLNLTLWTDEVTVSPTVHDWGYGLVSNVHFDEKGDNITSDMEGRHLELARSEIVGQPDTGACMNGGNQNNPSVAIDPMGNSMITWQDGRSGSDGIYARCFDSSDNPIGPDFAVVSPPNWERRPSIAVNSRGAFLLAWDGAGNGVDIFAQLFNATGARIGSQLTICSAPANQECARVAADASGGFVITWLDQRDGTRDVYARKINTNGACIGSDFAVHSGSGNQQSPAVAADSRNGFAIAWMDDRNGDFDIYARVFDSTGSPTGNEICVCGAAGFQGVPAVAFTSNDTLAIAWEDGRSGGSGDIFAKIFDPKTGVQIGTEITVCSAPDDQKNPAATAFSQNDVIIAWQDARNGPYDVFARAFNSTNTSAVGPEFLVINAANDQSMPAIAMDPDYGYVFVWQDMRNGNWDIYSRRFIRPYLSTGTCTGELRLASVPARLEPFFYSSTPPNTSILVRIGTSQDEINWSPWIGIENAVPVPRPQAVSWGPYVRYEIALNSTDSNVTPTVQDFRLGYDPYLLNASICSESILPASQGTVAGARPLLDCDQPAGTSLDIFLSTDNGTSWQKLENGLWSDFGSKGRDLRWKIDFSGDGNSTPLLRNMSIDYMVEEYPSDIALDVGNDGLVEWRFRGALNLTAHERNLATVLNDYVQSYWSRADAQGLVSVPVKISSATGGMLVLSADADILPLVPRILDFGPVGIEVPVDAPVTLSFCEPMNARTVRISISPVLELAPSWDAAGKNLTMSHPPFGGLTTYNVTVHAGALSTAGMAFEVDFSWKFTTMLLPVVVEHSPTGDGVALSSPIRIRFNGPMNTSTVDITVTPDLNLFPSWIGDMDTLSLGHQGLQPDTGYNVTLAPGARFVGGAAMAGGLSWEFRTAPRPAVLSVSPTGTNVRLDSPIRIAFSHKMNPGRVSVQISPGIPLNTVWSADGLNLTLGHDDFPEDTTFNLTIPAGAISSDGARMEVGFSWEFTTMLVPRVISFSPTGVNVPLSTSFSLEFNKPMNLSAFIGAISIDPPTDGEWRALAGGRIFGFTPNKRLQPKTDYTIALPGNVTDLEGNPLGKFSDWAFTTGEATVPPQTGSPWWILLVIVIAIVAIGAIYAGRRRPGGSKAEIQPAQSEVEATPPPAPVEATIPPPEATPFEESAVSVAPDLQFGPDLVMLGLSVSNKSGLDIERAVVKLLYDDNVVEIIGARPSYPLKGDDIQIGTVKACGKTDLTVEFKPAAIARTEIAGVLGFKDSEGHLKTVQIPPVTVAIDRPEFLTESNITTTKMMQRMAEGLEHTAARLFAMPPELSPQEAFEIGKAAIQRHDLRLVNQASEKDPYVGEAWYFGQVKGRREQVVVRTRYFEDRNVLEFFILSSSARLLAGLSLSLKEDLVRELIAGGHRPGIRGITEPAKIQEILSTRTLLDKESAGGRFRL